MITSEEIAEAIAVQQYFEQLVVVVDESAGFVRVRAYSSYTGWSRELNLCYDTKFGYKGNLARIVATEFINGSTKRG